MTDASSDIALARARDDLRRGEIVRITDNGRQLDILAAELATADRLAQLEQSGRADLLLTPERAQTLNILNQRPAAGAEAIAINRMPWLDLVTSLATADPVDDLSTPFKGPFPTRDLGPLARAAAAGLSLAKRATLLPALFAIEITAPTPDRLQADAAAILSWRRAPRLQIVSRARLPLDGAENTSVVAFRPRDGGDEHLALIIGEPGPTPLIRLHSACLTGDVLGSLKCDCGPQLRAAVQRIAAEGGILLYLQQEGRGIGLLNKLRAYQLQDQGFDTVDANLRLGFGEDERDFDLAGAMLKQLGVNRVRLLSNNPAKADALNAQGVEVTELVPHSFGENPHNRHYLETKRDRQGHKL
ncbi:GTP cyclohydrolase II [Sandaracinobacteroides hominis]|uniref:GTP cyclohydrolase II n=1 Tax=Sandaracinobacteroides hominis TaxID=2780086 RepID=UPI002E2ACD85|nr:GTP cyclohydrolase II [Sandaracinobacteroides hominis]